MQKISFDITKHTTFGSDPPRKMIKSQLVEETISYPSIKSTISLDLFKDFRSLVLPRLNFGVDLATWHQKHVGLFRNTLKLIYPQITSLVGLFELYPPRNASIQRSSLFDNIQRSSTFALSNSTLSSDSNLNSNSQETEYSKISLYQGFRAAFPHLASPPISRSHSTNLFDTLLDERDNALNKQDLIAKQVEKYTSELDQLESEIKRLDGLKQTLISRVFTARQLESTNTKNIESLNARIMLEGIGLKPDNPRRIIRTSATVSVVSNESSRTVLKGSCVLISQDGPVECLDFDDKILVTGSSDTLIRLWEIETQKYIGKFFGHTGWVTCLQKLDDYIISGSGDHSLKMWSIKSVRELFTFTGHTGGISSLQFDGDFLISGSADSKLIKWDLHSGHIISTLEVNSSESKYERISLDQALLCNPDFKGWTETHHIEKPAVLGGVTSVFFYYHAMAAGYGDGAVRLWDTRLNKYTRKIDAHQSHVTAAQFDDMLIFTGSYDCVFKVNFLA